MILKTSLALEKVQKEEQQVYSLGGCKSGKKVQFGDSREHVCLHLFSFLMKDYLSLHKAAVVQCTTNTTILNSFAENLVTESLTESEFRLKDAKTIVFEQWSMTTPHLL